jgi:hypothetical protein
LAFSEGIKGKPDHRAAWIDVTMTSTLGYKIPETIRPSMQRVTTKDMRSVQEFNKAMRAFVLRHQLGERITKLESTIHYPPTAAERQEAETLMQLRMEGIKARLSSLVVSTATVPRQRGGLVRYGISRIYPVERPEPIRKSWGSISFTRITMVSAFRICMFMRAQSLWLRT